MPLTNGSGFKSGSMPLTNGSGFKSGSMPQLMDLDSNPDPAIFVIDLQDANIKDFLLITF
jgi:hypothetical protein